MEKKIKILLAKPGLDLHDLGVKFIAKVLRDGGMEVVYTGLRQTPDQIVTAAIQEDVDVIGLSYLGGSYLGLTTKIINRLKEKNASKDFLVIVGGLIPKKDVDKIKAIGVAEVFPVGSPPQKVVEFVRQHAPLYREAS